MARILFAIGTLLFLLARPCYCAEQQSNPPATKSVCTIVFAVDGKNEKTTTVPLTSDSTVLDVLEPYLREYPDAWMKWSAYVDKPSSEVPALLTIDLHGIIKEGNSITNYRLMDGDRILLLPELPISGMKPVNYPSPFERLLEVRVLGVQVNEVWQAVRRLAGL